MALKYKLIKNPLHTHKNDYLAIPTKHEKLTTEDIIEQMANNGSTTTKADALALLEEFFQTVSKAVENGYSISTEIFKISPSISGTFEHPDSPLNSDIHKIHLNLSPGSRLSKAAQQIKTKRVPSVTPLPILHQFACHHPAASHNKGIPGQAASIKGHRLKINEDDPAQGIYFTNNQSHQVTKVSMLITNKPSELMFFIPDHLAGPFTIEVRTVFHNSKQLRKSRLDATITIEQP